MSGTKEAAVRLAGATVRYGAVQALSGLNLTIERGKVTVLLGPNGAGKTTAIRLMLGLSRPTEGSVTVFGQDPRSAPARRRVGVMMQVAKVPETLRVAEHIEAFRAYFPKPLSRAELIALAGLEGYERRLFGKLSGGEQQRVLFALALAGDPDLLFLDEPTVGMDVEARRAFWVQIRKLKAQGRTILLTTHYLEEADALADRVVVLNKGVIVADGTPGEIKQRASRRRIRARSNLDIAQVRGLPGVETAEMDGHMLTIDTTRLEDTLRALLVRDEGLSELEIAGAALEDAFVAITDAANSKEAA